MIINILIILTILILSFIYYIKIEYFNIQTGIKRGFNKVYNPFPICNNNNNCFTGYYNRSWINKNESPIKTYFNQVTKYKIPLQVTIN